MDLAGIVQRLDIPGLLLLVLGALTGFAGHRLAALLFPKAGEKAQVFIRFAGLAMAFLGALILLDVFA